MPKNPHAVLTRLFIILDPDGQAPLFEVPLVPPLPEELAFIPWEVARRRAPRSAVSSRT